MNQETPNAHLLASIIQRLEGIPHYSHRDDYPSILDRELKKVIQMAEGLTLRQLLHIRYTNKLSLIEKQAQQVLPLVQEQISRVSCLIDNEVNQTVLCLGEMEMRMNQMFYMEGRKEYPKYQMQR